jgi:hypothetical protein
VAGVELILGGDCITHHKSLLGKELGAGVRASGELPERLVRLRHELVVSYLVEAGAHSLVLILLCGTDDGVLKDLLRQLPVLDQADGS